jgi:hypothetical protein
MNVSYFFSNLMGEFHLWLMIYRSEFLALPWIAIVVAVVGTMLVSRMLITAISPLGANSLKEKFPFSQLIIAGLLLSLSGGIVYVLLPPLVISILWGYLLPLFLGLIAGAFSLLMGKGSTVFNNSTAIFGGNFYMDSQQSELSGIWQMLSRQLWEQPQSLIGNGLAQILNCLGFISSVQHMYGVTLIYGKIPLTNGVAFGSFVMVTYKNTGLNKEIDISDQQILSTLLIRHELGHSSQSRCSGPLYLWKYGVPSAISQAWTEKDAEARSDRWLLLDYGMAPVFTSYSKNYKTKTPGTIGLLLTIVFLIFGVIWGGYVGLVGAYLFISGIFILLNIGNRPNRFF